MESKSDAKPALPPMQESAKSPAVSFAATAAAPSPKAAEPKADAEALSASVRPAAVGEEERKDKKEKKAHAHSKSKKRLQLDASSSSPLPSPKPVATAATESVEHKPALAHQTSKLILAGSEACVQFVCSCCGGQNVVSLASLGLTLPTSGATSPPAPAPAASAALGASLARSASKGVRRLSDFVNTDVIHAQRVVRRWLMRKRWGRLVADVKNHSSSLYARLRNDTLKEIIQSEESYLAHLLLVVRLYVNPLTDLAARANVKRAPLMSRTEIFDVFSNFEVLADFHVELLQELKERALLYPTITHLGDIFVRMAPLMKLYSSYIRMYDVSTALLTDLRKNRPALNTWLNARSDGAECKGQPLESYLIMPVQRLPRYQMLLQQLLKYTSQEHVDFANLTKAIERVKSVLEVINVRAREEQDKHAMQLVRKRLHGALDEDDSRRLLYETTVKWRLRGGKLHKEATLLLFNNLILIVKESKGVMDKLFESNKKPGEQVPADVNLKVKRRLDLHESPVWETAEPNSVEVWTSTHPAEADRLQITFLDNIHCGNVVRVLQAIAASASSVSLVPVSPSPPGAHSSQSPRHSHKKSSATSVDLKKH